MKWLTYVLLGIAAILAGLLVYRQVMPKAVAGGTQLEQPVQLPPIELLDDQGKKVLLSDSRGRMRLIFYGFVRCPDVCPATLSALNNIYQKLTPQQQQKLYIQLISVDSTHDTPQRMRQYLNRFSPDFIGLTGDSARIDEAAQKMFVGITRPMPDPADHSAHMGHTAAPAPLSDKQAAALIHGDQVSVVTPDGRFVQVYNNREVITGVLEKDLPALLKHYGP